MAGRREGWADLRRKGVWHLQAWVALCRRVLQVPSQWRLLHQTNLSKNRRKLNMLTTGRMAESRALRRLAWGHQEGLPQPRRLNFSMSRLLPSPKLDLHTLLQLRHRCIRMQR